MIQGTLCNALETDEAVDAPLPMTAEIQKVLKELSLSGDGSSDHSAIAKYYGWIIYTTNAIEGLHRQFRKVTKTKGSFPNDQSLMKMLFLASQNISKKWTIRYRNWDLVIASLDILWGERAG